MPAKSGPQPLQSHTSPSTPLCYDAQLVVRVHTQHAACTHNMLRPAVLEQQLLLGPKPLHVPAAAFACGVAQAVVQARGASVPELDRAWPQQETAPVGRPWDVRCLISVHLRAGRTEFKNDHHINTYSQSQAHPPLQTTANMRKHVFRFISAPMLLVCARIRHYRDFSGANPVPLQSGAGVPAAAGQRGAPARRGRPAAARTGC